MNLRQRLREAETFEQRRAALCHVAKHFEHMSVFSAILCVGSHAWVGSVLWLVESQKAGPLQVLQQGGEYFVGLGEARARNKELALAIAEALLIAKGS